MRRTKPRFVLKSRVGIVYILQSRRFPGVIKVGRTQRTPGMRMDELAVEPGYRGFAPWDLYHAQVVQDVFHVERHAHRILRRRGRLITLDVGCQELYRVPPKEAQDVIHALAANLEEHRLKAWMGKLFRDLAIITGSVASVVFGLVWLVSG